MKQILFVIAMEKEAIDITKKLGLNEITNIINNKVRIFRKENITLLLAGIGKQQTAINLVQYLEKNDKPDLIINIGYAGSTNSKIGEWVNVNKSYNYEWDITGEQAYTIEGFDREDIINTLKNTSIKKLPCYSAEAFVTSTNLAEDVLFDMELHSIYMICCMYGIKLISLKKISDNLSLEDYYKNIDMKDVLELTSVLEIIRKEL